MAKVLICGGDDLLAEIRARVLQSAALDAEWCLGIDALRQRENLTADLFVLCSSLSVDCRSTAYQWLSDRRPGVPVINIRRTLSEPSAGSHTLQSYDRPDQLIALSKLLTSRVAARRS